jgi:hypothetical protein
MRYWQGREKYGAAFDVAETNDISEVLGETFSSLPDARSAFAEAIKTDRVSMPDAIRLCCHRVAREMDAARRGLGPLADSTYPPLI